MGLQAFPGTTVGRAVLPVGAVRSPQLTATGRRGAGLPDFVQPDQLRCPVEEHAAPFGVTTLRVQMTHVAAGQEFTKPGFRRRDGPRHGRRFYSNSGLSARLLAC